MGLFSRKSQASDSDLACPVVAILNQKGGVGKTTLTFNIAHAMAAKGKKVLCVDMDPQANLSLLCGVEDVEQHIFQLLINSLRELKNLHAPLMVQDVIQSAGNVDILPAGQELSGFELSVAGINSPRQLIFKKFLKNSGLDELYDVILVDGPPTLGLITVNILCGVNGVIVPFQPDQFSHKGLNHFHDVLEDVDEMGVGGAPKILGYIPNLVESRRKQANEDFAEIVKEFGGEDIPFFEGIPNRVQLVKSSAKRKSVFDFSSKEYQGLQKNFLDMAERIQEAW